MGLCMWGAVLALFAKVNALMEEGRVLAAYTPTFGGIAEAIYKMSIGNGFGFGIGGGTGNSAGDSVISMTLEDRISFTAITQP